MTNVTLESREYSTTMMPLAYQPTSAACGWLIVAHKMTITPIQPTHNRGKGRSISALIQKRKESSPEAASALAQARKRLAQIKRANQSETTHPTLRDLRLDQGLSQSDLAELMGTQQSYISKIEKNSVELRVPTIKSLAKALNTTCDQIIEAIEHE